MKPPFQERWQRALFWPVAIWHFRRDWGLPWRLAYRATHFWVWNMRKELDDLYQRASDGSRP